MNWSSGQRFLLDLRHFDARRLRLAVLVVADGAKREVLAVEEVGHPRHLRRAGAERGHAEPRGALVGDAHGRVAMVRSATSQFSHLYPATVSNWPVLVSFGGAAGGPPFGACGPPGPPPKDFIMSGALFKSKKRTCFCASMNHVELLRRRIDDDIRRRAHRRTAASRELLREIDPELVAFDEERDRYRTGGRFRLLLASRRSPLRIRSRATGMPPAGPRPTAPPTLKRRRPQAADGGAGLLHAHVRHTEEAERSPPTAERSRTERRCMVRMVAHDTRRRGSRENQ